jgi:hypothetical protein
MSMFRRTCHCIFPEPVEHVDIPLSASCSGKTPPPPCTLFLTLIMFDVESVIDQVPHSENSSSFVTFSLISKLFSAYCLYLQNK